MVVGPSAEEPVPLAYAVFRKRGILGYGAVEIARNQVERKLVGIEEADVGVGFGNVEVFDIEAVVATQGQPARGGDGNVRIEIRKRRLFEVVLRENAFVEIEILEYVQPRNLARTVGFVPRFKGVF